MRLGTKLLIDWRQTQGLSQALAAKRFGVAQPSYREWEHDTIPKLDQAMLVEKGTGGKVPMKSWTVELDEPAPSGPSIDEWIESGGRE